MVAYQRAALYPESPVGAKNANDGRPHRQAIQAAGGGVNWGLPQAGRIGPAAASCYKDPASHGREAPKRGTRWAFPCECARWSADSRTRVWLNPLACWFRT